MKGSVLLVFCIAIVGIQRQLDSRKLLELRYGVSNTLSLISPIM
jgi:hypothetical protein